MNTKISAPKFIKPTHAPINQERNKNVYTGEEALKNYLNPANYPPTPLIELPSDLNPFRENGVRLLAKMMPMVPLMNIKSLPAFSMLQQAAERGDLESVEKIVESSSSNTVLSLSVMARLFGIDHTHAIVDHSIAPGLLKMLRLFGIEIFLHPGLDHKAYDHMEPRSQRATNLGQQPGWFNPGQYSNPDNPEAFAKWLAPDLLAQTEGKLSVFACSLGTCGTMVGVGKTLRNYNPTIEVVACYPSAGDFVPGPRERKQLADVSFDWQNTANTFLELTAKQGFASSVDLLRRGIMAGPSSGLNYAAMLKYLEQEKASGRLEIKVQEQGEIYCVFMCCDSPLQHVEDYFKILGEEFFSTVHPVPEIAAPNKNSKKSLAHAS